MSTATLETITNTPKTFTIDGKDYKVKQFNLIELSEIRQYLTDEIKRDYKRDIAELATTVDAKDRPRFVIDAVKQNVITEAQINEAMMSRRGLVKILSIACKVGIELVELWLKKDELQNTILEIFEHVLGLKPANETNETNEGGDNIDTEKKI